MTNIKIAVWIAIFPITSFASGYIACYSGTSWEWATDSAGHYYSAEGDYKNITGSSIKKFISKTKFVDMLAACQRALGAEEVTGMFAAGNAYNYPIIFKNWHESQPASKPSIDHESTKNIYDKLSNHSLNRPSMNMNEGSYVIVDLGGEGYQNIFSVESGFKSAININVRETSSQSGLPIPYLIKIDSFDKEYPIGNNVVDYMIMQGAPLTKHNVNEIERMLRLGGQVGLWIDEDVQENKDNIKELEKKLRTIAIRGSAAQDEFAGKNPNPKILLKDNRFGTDLGQQIYSY